MGRAIFNILFGLGGAAVGIKAISDGDPFGSLAVVTCGMLAVVGFWEFAAERKRGQSEKEREDRSGIVQPLDR